MNSEMYIKDMKEKFESVEDWVRDELNQHYIAFINGDIDKINNDFVSFLKSCDTWEEALEIATNFII